MSWLQEEDAVVQPGGATPRTVHDTLSNLDSAYRKGGRNIKDVTQLAQLLALNVNDRGYLRLSIVGSGRRCIG